MSLRVVALSLRPWGARMAGLALAGMRLASSQASTMEQLLDRAGGRPCRTMLTAPVPAWTRSHHRDQRPYRSGSCRFARSASPATISLAPFVICSARTKQFGIPPLGYRGVSALSACGSNVFDDRAALTRRRINAVVAARRRCRRWWLTSNSCPPACRREQLLPGLGTGKMPELDARRPIRSAARGHYANACVTCHGPNGSRHSPQPADYRSRLHGAAAVGQPTASTTAPGWRG